MRPIGLDLSTSAGVRTGEGGWAPGAGRAARPGPRRTCADRLAAL